MSKFLGRDCVFEFFHNGGWKTFACCRSVTLSSQTEFMETSVSGSGKDATFLPTKNSHSFQGNGVMAQETGMLSFADIRALQYAHTRIRIRFTRTSRTSQVYTSLAYAYIESTTDVGSFDDMALFDFSGRIDGPIQQNFTPNPATGNKVYRLEITGTQGMTTYADSALLNKDIIEVVKDGIGFSKVITAGTPVNKEALYTADNGSGEGELEWAIPFEDGEEGYVLYQDL